MITTDQIKDLSIIFQMDEYSIFREYLQLVFLSYLYQEKEASKIIFKGGTALRLLFGSPRFSEDLDFSTNCQDSQITRLLKKIVGKISRELPNIKLDPLYKGKEGIRFRIIYNSSEFKYPLSIRLDFHQQKIIKNRQISTLTTRFPVMIFPQIFHLSEERILSEKFKALEFRQKGRDIFDIWWLLSRGIRTGKLKDQIIKRLESIPQTVLVKDLGKFLPRGQKKIIPVLQKEVINWLLINRRSRFRL
ncbi:MAG: nucleotidyl transferase AbiEii/AbiGii toxin family protein [Patescibacteria group bacterium]